MSLPIRRFFVVYVMTALVFLLCDAAWLTTMAAALYRPAIGHLMRTDFAVVPAVLFYAIYLLGVVVFVIREARDTKSAFARGALFGFVCYATYDLTNQATLVAWPWSVTLADLAWGAFVTGTSSAVGHRVGAGLQP